MRNFSSPPFVARWPVNWILPIGFRWRGGILLLLVFADILWAGPFSVDLEKVGEGGGASTSSVFSVTCSEIGTIFGTAVGGPFSVRSGGSFLSLFDVDSRVVTISTDEGGSTVPSGFVEVEVGDDLEIVSLSEVYYHIDQVLVNQSPIVDGINRREYRLDLTNVVADLAVHTVVLPDTTGKGTPHYWLVQHAFTNDAFEVEADRDQDSDGLLTWEEWIADTNPSDTRDRFSIRTLTHGEGTSLEFQSSEHRVYSLDFRMSLQSGSWIPVAGQREVPGSGGIDRLIDPSTSSGCVYRVRVELPPSP